MRGAGTSTMPFTDITTMGTSPSLQLVHIKQNDCIKLGLILSAALLVSASAL